MPVIVLQLTQNADTETLVALLEDALSSEDERRAMLTNASLTSYTAHHDSKIVGTVVVRWDAEGEIELLAVDKTRRGQGLGRAIVAAILEEARLRGVKRLLVGTGNFSLDNIAFYQKCGFRMSHVRRGYFDTVDPPEFWRGIKLRDMIMFDYILGEQANEL